MKLLLGAWYVVLIIVQAPLRLLKSRIGVMLFLGAIILMVVFGVIDAQGQKGQVAIPDYQQRAPKTAWVVPTETRVYYVDTYRELPTDDRYWELQSYYYYDKVRWEKGKLPLPVLKDRAKIYRNDGGQG